MTASHRFRPSDTFAEMHFCGQDLAQLCLTLVFVFICLLIIFTLVLKLISRPVPVITRHESEEHFFDSKSQQRVKFPSLMKDEPTVYLSVIVPAFNEEQRLPKMLDEAIEYLEKRCTDKSNRLQEVAFTYEIIVVDDGSDDKTSDVVLQYVSTYGIEKIRLLKLNANRGKGGAVRLGMMSARGRLLLFADADGATQFSDFGKLEDFMVENQDSVRPPIAIGSRAHLQEEAIATRSLFRTILMYGFHFGVWLLAVRSIKDTQCGFKLFDRPTARILFSHIHCQKWAFDVELLLIAEHLNCNISEIAVKWTEIDGSKVVPFWSWLQMGRDVALISLKYAVGASKMPRLDLKSD